ncbi:hypothetical protein [Amycolatopsis tolypomycina]|uniref:hypothetical protein n=1 Tax=Amycolatopsis tolypomycina TaxID=208445 RepID=UPI00115F97CD|nr:hypothetical protein [Amycolatopsis tolypomycina]
MLIWCSLATVGCLAGIIDSFTEWAPHLPSVLWVVPLVGVFPIVLVVAAALALRRERESPVHAVFGAGRSLSSGERWAAAILVLAAGVVAAIAAAGLRNGTPEVTATGYQLYTRLGSTPITRTEYLHELAGSQRLFAALGFGLNVLFAAFARGTMRRGSAQ